MAQRRVVNAATGMSGDVLLSTQEADAMLVENQAWIADTPAREDAVRDAEASRRIDDALMVALRDLFLDMEQRMRAAGQASTLPTIAAANTKAEYTAALKALVKSNL